MDMVTRATHMVDTLATTIVVLVTHMGTEPSTKTRNTEFGIHLTLLPLPKIFVSLALKDTILFFVFCTFVIK